MRKNALLLTLATVCIVANAQMKSILNIRPMQQYVETKDINFNLTDIAELLKTDKKTLCRDFNEWISIPDTVEEYTQKEWLMEVVTDGGKAERKKTGHDRNALTADGKIVTIDNYSEAVWFYNVSMSEEMNALTFTIGTTNGTDLQDGMRYHAGIELKYNGRTVTFDIEANFSSRNIGNTLSIADMQKVGEKMIAVKVEKDEPAVVKLPVKELAGLFGEKVTEDMIGYYVMVDGQKQIISDICNNNNYGAAVCMDAEGVVTEKYDHKFYNLEYIRYGEENDGKEAWKVFANTLNIWSNPDMFSNGEKAYTSVFFIYDNRFYEYLLDIQFGDYGDKLNDIKVVDVISQSTLLEKTRTFATYNERFGEDGNSLSSDESVSKSDFALIKAEVDMKKIADLIGTDNPVIYAEQIKDGNIIYTSNYSAGPGQGFWFAGTGNGVYAEQLSLNSVFGFYYSDGSIKWYENPNTARVGDKASINIYFVNRENGKAVKIVEYVEIVEKINETPNFARVRKLPMQFEELNPTAIDCITAPKNKYNTIYNINGQRLNGMSRGINIINGKKVIVK